MGESVGTKRKTSTPPDGYVCNACQTPGHWIQQCPENKKRKKNKRNPDHVFQAGVDPSTQDIQDAQRMQKIKPPNCFCGQTSRLKKVKKSREGGDNSRAIGKYFFFCSKPKDHDTKCRFARPVEDEMTPKKERLCTFFMKNGSCKKGDKCMFSHDVEGKEGQTKKNGRKDKEKIMKTTANAEAEDSTISKPEKAETSDPKGDDNTGSNISDGDGDDDDDKSSSSSSSSSSINSDSDSSDSDDDNEKF
eukprot:CAMPEP_0195287608 /NCGR_PEP_ID=MMETSP0707-20130614/4593_1 /TAXON_ID=33640 /ORGANISM="Asterionellopsis glacialis, Strain CCMP134" /LENGTH=246 /DNA_ID=CAMNT_0040347375 /DNA_START=91 /DNA_END=831 /DNA_ORIENTATION=+